MSLAEAAEVLRLFVRQLQGLLRTALRVPDSLSFPAAGQQGAIRA